MRLRARASQNSAAEDGSQQQVRGCARKSHYYSLLQFTHIRDVTVHIKVVKIPNRILCRVCVCAATHAFVLLFAFYTCIAQQQRAKSITGHTERGDGLSGAVRFRPSAIRYIFPIVVLYYTVTNKHYTFRCRCVRYTYNKRFDTSSVLMNDSTTFFYAPLQNERQKKNDARDKYEKRDVWRIYHQSLTKLDLILKHFKLVRECSTCFVRFSTVFG